MQPPVKGDDDLLEDGDFWPIILRLQGCLEVEYARSGIEIGCFSGPLPGAGIESELLTANECGAMGFIRLANVYPTNGFPALDEGGGTCESQLAATIEVGLHRIAPTPNRKGLIPKTEWFEAARHTASDMAALRRAIKCCIKDFEEETRQDLPFALGTWDAVGPEGGVVGGSWTIVIGTY